MRLRDKALSVTTSDEPDIAIAAISAQNQAYRWIQIPAAIGKAIVL
ncbi:MAG: hypothetical protein ACM3TS_00035 [Clostridia bacterium]